MRILKELAKRENGQGVAEYALILSGLTLLVFVAVFIFGNKLVQFYNDFVNTI